MIKQREFPNSVNFNKKEYLVFNDSSTQAEWTPHVCVFFPQHDLEMIQRVSMEAITSDILCFFLLLFHFKSSHDYCDNRAY